MSSDLRPSASEYDEYTLVADLYDYVPMYCDRADVEFYVDAAKASRGPVLEVGCGTGRILIFRFEVEHLLTTCGFEVEHLYAGYDRQPFGSVYPGELVFVARKR